jgi:hypothetical protein
MSSEFHASAALPSGTGPPVHFRYEAPRADPPHYEEQKYILLLPGIEYRLSSP